jgi:predicted enzyme related to lactoylglutathione lyase
MNAHPIVHLELSANDPAAASKFYSELCGWQIEHAPEFDYYQFRADGGPGGGFVQVGGPSAAKAGDVLPYIGTDDIDAMLKKAESLGAKTIVPKSEIPMTGWFAVFEDPTGNRVGLYTSMRPQQ